MADNTKDITTSYKDGDIGRMIIQKSKSPSPNQTYFQIPSLYTKLAEDDVETIEKILASDFVAPVPEAETALSALPDRLRLHHVTLIVRALNLLYLWEFRAAYALLSAFVSSKSLIEGIVPEELLLIQTLLAFADIVFNGSFTLARSCLSDLKDLLMQIRLEDYTDLTVRTVPVIFI